MPIRDPWAPWRALAGLEEPDDGPRPRPAARPAAVDFSDVRSGGTTTSPPSFGQALREIARGAAGVARQVGRGLADSGSVTQEGVARLNQFMEERAPGAFALDRAINSRWPGLAQPASERVAEIQRAREEAHGFYGEPTSGVEVGAQITGRLAGDLAMFMAPGVGAGRAGLLPNIAAGGLGGAAKRAALYTAVASPITIAQAGSPFGSSTAALADLTGNETLGRLAESVPGRVAGDLGLDLMAGGAVEGVMGGLRAAGRTAQLVRGGAGDVGGLGAIDPTAPRRVLTPTERGRAIGARLAEDVRAGRVDLNPPPPAPPAAAVTPGQSLAAEGAAAREAGTVLPVSMDDPRLLAPSPAAEARAVAARDAEAARNMMFRGAPSPQGVQQLMREPEYAAIPLPRRVRALVEPKLEEYGPTARVLNEYTGATQRGENAGGIHFPERLERALREGWPEAKEMEAAFAPVREQLRQEYGDKVTLYRAQRDFDPDDVQRETLSWTADPRYAQQHVLGSGGRVVSREIPLDDVVWVTNRMDQSEFIVRNRGEHAIHPPARAFGPAEAAAQAGKAAPPAVTGLAGAGLGGAAGAALDDENPSRGFAVGAGVGALGGGFGPSAARMLARGGEDATAAGLPRIGSTHEVPGGTVEVLGHGTGGNVQIRYTPRDPGRNAPRVSELPWQTVERAAATHRLANRPLVPAPETHGGLGGTVVTDEVGAPRTVFSDSGQRFGDAEADVVRAQNPAAADDLAPESAYGPGHYFTEDAAVAGTGARPAQLAVRTPFRDDLATPLDEAERIYRLAGLDEHADALQRQRVAAELAGGSASEETVSPNMVFTVLRKALGRDGAGKVLRAGGYDGVTFIGRGSADTGPHRAWVAFDRGQVFDAPLPRGADYSVARGLAGAGLGAAGGAALDDEDRVRGALGGAVAGAAGGAFGPAALRSMVRHTGNEIGALGDIGPLVRVREKSTIPWTASLADGAGADVFHLETPAGPLRMEVHKLDADGTAVHVSYLGGPAGMQDVGAVNRLGRGGLRGVESVLREHYPNMQHLSGFRASGMGPGRVASRVVGEEGFASTPLVTGLAGAGAGGAAGAALDDENRIRGALTGAAVGGLGGAALGSTLSRARGGPLPLPANVRPAYSAAERDIDFTGALARAADREAKGTFRARLERFLDSLATSHGPIQRLGEASDLPPTRNPRDLLTQVKSLDATVRRAFYEGVPDPFTRSTLIGPSFKAVVEPLGDNPRAIRQAFTYAVNERLLGRGLEGFGGDAVKYANAQAVVNHFRTLPEIAEFSTRLRAYIDALGDYAVRSGLWTPEQWKAIRDSDALYIPTRRIMGATVPKGAAGMAAGSGKLSNVGPGVKGFTGSSRAVYDPATSLAEYTRDIIRRADTYRTSAAIIEAVDALGPEGGLILSRVPGGAAGKAAERRALAAHNAENLGVSLPAQAIDAVDDLLPVAIDSKNPVIWRNLPGGGRDERLISSPDLLRAVGALPGMGDDGIHAFLDAVLLPLKRVFTATTTAFSLPFTLVTNPSRDIVDTLAKTRSGVGPLDLARGYANGIGGAFGKSRLDAMLKQYGLGNVTLWHDAAHTSPRQFQREVAPTTTGQRLRGRGRKAALRASGITLLEAVGNASESGFRNAEAIASVRRTQPLVDAGQWTVDDQMLRAATEGRELIDFTNRPGMAVLRDVARYVPFFGAAVQGGVTMTRASMRNPRRVATVAAGVASAATVAWALKHRSEEVLDRENDRMPTERAGFLFFPMDEAGQWTVRVPMSQELGVVAAGVTAGLDAWRDHDPHAAAVLVEGILRALPPGVNEAVRGRPTVPVPGLQQVLENRANRRDFGGAPIESREMQELPLSERRRDATPITADLIAAGARAAGIEDADSPVKAENLMRGVTSRYTPFITAVTDPIAGRILGRDAPDAIPSGTPRNPLNPASTLFADPTPSATASQERYYDTKDRAGQAAESLRAAAEAGDGERVQRTMRDFPDVANDQAQEIIAAADREVKDLRAMEDVVRESFRTKEIDGERARELLDGIAAERQKVYREADRLLRRAADAPARGQRR